jgi:hypothetical protein
MSETPQETLAQWQSNPGWWGMQPEVREAIRAVLEDLRLRDIDCGCNNRVTRLEAERDALRIDLQTADDQLRALRAEVERLRIALLLSAAAEARIRARWPHIEVPTKGSAGLLGRQVVIDPGSPTCLRCSIEDEIRGPEHRKHPSGDYCTFCRSQWPCEESEP